MKDAKIGIVFNPRSGKSQRILTRSVSDRVINFFANKGLSITIRTTSAPGEGSKLAREFVQDGYTHVIACGGDGTINEVANGLVGRKAVMGFIPMGTENVFCTSMGIPLDIDRACEHFFQAEEKLIDVGIANQRYYLVMSGIGMDARVIFEMDPDVKAVLGGIGFLLKGAMLFLFESEKFKANSRVKLLDKNEEFKTDAWLILVGNLPNYTGYIKVAPDARPDDGLLDILVFPYRENELGTQVLNTITGTHLEKTDVKHFKSSDFRIITDPPVYCQIDGEILGKTPVHYRVYEKGLKIKA